ncbi:MAG TPA: hypothetical protein VHW01_20835, partial [Polyangiaceae bacterium]|nr:hypothetical protein [Polyangiaceae bacterium]
RRGGLARAARESKLRSLETLGLRAVEGGDLSQAAPFLADGEAWAQHHITRLAQCVGGGECSAGPSSLVQSAALALAASRFLYSRGDPADFKQASALANDSRMNLLAAHELCAREAVARSKQPGALSPGLSKFFGDGAAK